MLYSLCIFSINNQVRLNFAGNSRDISQVYAGKCRNFEQHHLSGGSCSTLATIIQRWMDAESASHGGLSSKPKNAPSPISVIELGMIKLVKEVQP